jgi:formylglycine-generating enzyme required for sulfatase activity/uncharacterized protein with PQ loop repeat
MSFHEIIGFVAGLGTTFAAMPDFILMLRRRSSQGMNPTMAAILGTFQILWVYYGFLIESRPVMLWNLVAAIVNFLTVGTYLLFASSRWGDLRWRENFLAGIRRGTRIVIYGTGLVIVVLIAWRWTRWGLDELNASVTVTRTSSLCEAIRGFGPEMIVVEGGQFIMGADARSGSVATIAEGPIHNVTIEPFAVGTCGVTFEEYDRFAEATKRSLPDDSGWGRGRRPVINVSWQDAKAYAVWLSEQTDKRYRLLTEAEREYAARSGGKNEIWAGTSDEEELKNYAVYAADSHHRTATVGSKKPNGLGLYDMSGNVSEWVADCWHASYEGAPTDGSAWFEANGGDCGRRVVRGGSWSAGPEGLRASLRYRGDAARGQINIGFRLAHDLP